MPIRSDPGGKSPEPDPTEPHDRFAAPSNVPGRRRSGGRSAGSLGPALALLTLLGCGSAARELVCRDCNLVVVSIDTLRADRLGCYGNPRPTSPRLDAMAADSIFFEQAISASYHTADSHMSIFTATAPSVHEVSNASSQYGNPLAPGLTTLAEALALAGFATAGFHGGGNVSPPFGFGRGFETYKMTTDLSEGVAWVESRRGTRFFLFLHTYKTHDPYTPSPGSLREIGVAPRPEIESDLERLKAAVGDRPFPALRDQFWSAIDKDDPADVEYAMALYDGEIREVDSMVSDVVAEVLRRAPRTIVVVTSDHGEEFGEHGKFLHDSLFQEVLHVPLWIWIPGAGGMRVPERVSQIDLAPTLLDLLVVARQPSFQGHSWLPALSRKGSFRRGLVAEKMLVIARGDGVRPEIRRFASSVVVGDEKVLRRSPKLEPELYDLAVDPGERQELSASDPERMARAISEMDRLLAGNDRFAALVPRAADGGAVELSPELVDQLRALGYL